MAPRKNTSEPIEEENKIKIEGLEALLKKCFNDGKLQVVEYEATKLLPPGENYCSVMIKLDLRIRRSATEEVVYLVAKTPSSNENSLIDWPLIFKKEVFMYAELHQLYRVLEKEAGVEEHELIDAWPRYVWHRNSLKDGDEVDEHSMILMENIKIKGFYNMDRKKGLDLRHASKALSSLARYHALGIVMKQRRPKFAEKAIQQASIFGMDLAYLDKAYDSILQTIRKIPCIQKHLSVIESSFERAREGKLYTIRPEEPWISISHGDFWTNNMLFHTDEAGNVDDVKFVDFQLYLYASPLKDLIYFFTGSLDTTTQTDHMDEIIDVYYGNFIETLNRMSCDTSPFSRQSFECELKKQAINQMPLCTMAIKFFIFEVNCDNDDKNGRELANAVLKTGASDILQVKLEGLTEMYERMGWF